jgi:hypothetical protein
MINTILISVLVIFLLCLVVIVVPFWLIRKFDRRAARGERLFTGPATPARRVFALVLGVLFAGFLILMILSGADFASPEMLILPVIAVALLGYGLGVGKLLASLQGRGRTSIPKESNETAIGLLKPDQSTPIIQETRLPFGTRFLAVLLASVIFLYGAWWSATHWDSPLAWLFVLGAFLFFVLAWIVGWVRFIKSSRSH